MLRTRARDTDPPWSRVPCIPDIKRGDHRLLTYLLIEVSNVRQIGSRAPVPLGSAAIAALQHLGITVHRADETSMKEQPTKPETSDTKGTPQGNPTGKEAK